ncbi:ARF GAP-like zinc finger-containing protein ZIGA4 [Actinidia rufa]|uniref:ARF GAP-like zinc finger-containing protein ZIGA4 n=1 Tax=Actinidia rufa TaxID=165716 RepID=A0A7J0FHA0_9ERIC|nr:ARF GAP-like zinc finger-containing protein ZIGA4 [Actinidia rufa]
MAKFTSQEVEALQKGGNQNLRHHEDETRRASSYHSYSQSPPYDYQYEERRYGKQAHALTRKPGSDRGLYEGRLSSFFSPSRISDQMHEDSFANEGSNPRASDYSVSSAGDPFRSDATQSPNFQRDIGMRSPPQLQLSSSSFPLRIWVLWRCLLSFRGSFRSSGAVKMAGSHARCLSDPRVVTECRLGYGWPSGRPNLALILG